mgnify:CR=1 FL=1
MAITIDGKQYDETKLDDKHKNAIVQVSQAQAKLKPVSYTHLTLPTTD